MKFLVLTPVILGASFAMYLQYRMLSEARRNSRVWKLFCVVPVAAVGIFLIWAALRVQ